MRTIFSYLSPYKIRITFGLLIKSIGTFSELFLPMIMAYMIDEIAPYRKRNFTGRMGYYNACVRPCRIVRKRDSKQNGVKGCKGHYRKDTQGSVCKDAVAFR